MKLKKIYENDDVKVIEEKINTLYYSNPIYLKEEDEMDDPEGFLKKSQGKVLESDWDKRKCEWSHFVELFNNKTGVMERLWFLESELYLV